MARKEEEFKCELNQIVAYSDRVASLEELARVVGLTKRQVQYRLQKSNESLREEVREKINNVAKATRNNGTKTLRIKFLSGDNYVIDPGDSQFLIDEGKCLPNPYDIVYMVHRGTGATKLLVKEAVAETNKRGVKLECVVLRELYCEFLKNCMENSLSATDVAVLSRA